MTKLEHPSNSKTQLDAQQLILDIAARKLSANWEIAESGKRSQRILLENESYVMVDGISKNPQIV